MPHLHIFIDESGNFDFSLRGTKYFHLTAVSTLGCPELLTDVYDLKHRIALTGLGLEEFHAAEDRQLVRDQMYEVLGRHAAHRCYAVDALIIQKNRVRPDLRGDALFYSRMLRVLLRWVVRHRIPENAEKILMWTARIGTNRQRHSFEKAVRTSLARDLPVRIPYHVFIHSSASHPMLQVADYCCWAVAKKWKDGELRPYAKVQSAIMSELEIFRRGGKEYY